MNIFDKLRDYGADMVGIDDRFADDGDFFVSCLNMLYEEKCFDDLSDAMEKGDIKQAFNAAHGLKGLIGNLGLTPFYVETCSLVEALRAGYMDMAKEVYPNVITEFEKVKRLTD